MQGLTAFQLSRVVPSILKESLLMLISLMSHLERKKVELSAWLVSARRASRLAPLDLAAHCPGCRSESELDAYLQIRRQSWSTGLACL